MFRFLGGQALAKALKNKKAGKMPAFPVTCLLANNQAILA